MSVDKNLHDVIVVGAGISGLYTAKCLAEEGLDVVVLEARDRVGGRAWTLRNERFSYADMGGAYLGSSQTEVLALANELGLEIYDLPTRGDTILHFGNIKSRYRENSVPLSRMLGFLDFNHMINVLDAHSKQVPTEKPWEATRAVEWDNISVADFLEKECWTRVGCDLTIAAIYTMYGTNPRQISLLSFLWEIRNCGGVKFLFSSQDGAQSMKIKGGSNSISEKMAQILADKVKLNVTVTSVRQHDDTITLITQDDIVYKTRKVVIALCPPLLKQIDMVPPLPPDQQCFVDHLPECKSYKTMTFYDKPYWENKGLRGEFLSQHNIAGYGLPDTKPDGTHPAIMSFIDDMESDGNLKKEDRKRALATQYADLFDCPELLHPCDYEEKYWGDEESKLYSGVCVYSLPPGLLTTHKSLWGRPYGNLFFAGVESSPVMHGYMDGGVRAGERAAKQVLDSLGVQPKRHYRTTQNPPELLHRPLVERILPSVGQLYFLCAISVAIPAVYVAMKLS